MSRFVTGCFSYLFRYVYFMKYGPEISTRVLTSESSRNPVSNESPTGVEYEVAFINFTL